MTISMGAIARNQWTGLSSDTKPTKSNNVGASVPVQGDLFFETDTGKAFIYSPGSDSWVAWPPFQNVSQGAFARQPNSGVNGYAAVTRFGGRAHRIHATTAVNLSGPTIGTAGIIGDTFISAMMILAAAGPPTATLTGFGQDETSAAQTIVLTGTTAGVPTIFQFDQLINYAAAAQITASVADVVWVWHGTP